jgi:hypothetical protein
MKSWSQGETVNHDGDNDDGDNHSNYDDGDEDNDDDDNSMPFPSSICFALLLSHLLLLLL